MAKRHAPKALTGWNPFYLLFTATSLSALVANAVWPRHDHPWVGLLVSIGLGFGTGTLICHTVYFRRDTLRYRAAMDELRAFAAHQEQAILKMLGNGQ